MKAIILFISIFFVVNCFSSNVHAQDQQSTTSDEQNLLWTYGIKLNVDDMAKAKSFYVGKLGFEIDEERSNAE